MWKVVAVCAEFNAEYGNAVEGLDKAIEIARGLKAALNEKGTHVSEVYAEKIDNGRRWTICCEGGI